MLPSTSLSPPRAPRYSGAIIEHWASPIPVKTRGGDGAAVKEFVTVRFDGYNAKFDEKFTVGRDRLKLQPVGSRTAPWADGEVTSFCYHVDVVAAEGRDARPAAEASATASLPKAPTRWSVTSLGLPMLITHRKSTTCAEMIDLVAQRVRPLLLHGAVAAAATVGGGAGGGAGAAGGGPGTERSAGSADGGDDFGFRNPLRASPDPVAMRECSLCTVTFYANLAHSLTRSP